MQKENKAINTERFHFMFITIKDQVDHWGSVSNLAFLVTFLTLVNNNQIETILRTLQLYEHK